MAGDWIPFCKDLPGKPEVLRIADATGYDRRTVVCMLLEFWAWADGQTEDGLLRGVSVRNLSALHADMGRTFFGQLVDVGWLVEVASGVEIPNFDFWMGNAAKRRLKDAMRKRRRRHDPTTCPQDVRKQSGHSADKTRTTEQNRTEEEKTEDTPLPPVLDTLAFREAWSRWLAHRREIRKPMKPTSQAATLKRLAAWGHDRAVAALEHSLANGWQGIFEPKEESHGGRVGANPARVRAAAGKYAGTREIIAGQAPPAQPAGPSPPEPPRAAGQPDCPGPA